MGDTLIHPGLVLIGAALVLPWLRGAVRAAAVVLVPLVALALVWQVPDGAAWQLRYLDYTLTPLAGDRLSRLFASLFALAAAGGGLFALGQASRLEVPAAFVYAGSAIGVTLAGDLVSVFVFWELMAIGSTLVIWSEGGERSRAAAQRYLMIHLLGGVLLFAGIAGHVASTGTLVFQPMLLDSAAHWLILAGFLVNAAAPPLSAWLPDAYPESSWSGMVFLSAFTTKTAVYALMRGFPGNELLVWLGLVMVVYGVVYAVLENDVRRVLAYAIVYGVGFMVTAVGIGTPMALNGAAAYAVAHVLYKSLLLMAAGSVLRATGRRGCLELGGLYRTMPFTAACAVVGALAAASFPLTAAFVSKSMILQAAADGHINALWTVLTAAAAGAMLHAGLKVPWFVFFGRDAGVRAADPPAAMRVAMLVFAAACVLPGLWPAGMHRLLPYPDVGEPYTTGHVLAQLLELAGGALVFFLLLPILRRSMPGMPDTDWVWRRLLPAAAEAAGRVIRAALAAMARTVRRVLEGADRALDERRAALLRTWPTRGMALWVLVLLLGYLVLYYV
jgi:multicomponent Na+:H+ antiporter subunit D